MKNPDDILLMDVKSSNLRGDISELFNIKYLSNATIELDEINGVLYGPSHRLIGPMTINFNDKIKNIFVILDTGAPVTNISEEVLHEYKITVPKLNTKYVYLNKRRVDARISPANSIYGDLNILGTDFLYEHQAQLTADFTEGKFNVKFRAKTY
jgi:hypothetical protein